MLLAAKTAILACLSLCTTAVLGTGYKTIDSQYGDNKIRFKSWSVDDTSVCRGGTAHHAGWADIGSRHLFFWFHEARSGRKDAPLMIWQHGGPGGSSVHAMLYEHGPCLTDDANSTNFNPYSWAEHYNIVYLDQPAGVGFSYVEKGGVQPSRAEDSSLDAVAFLRLFYEAFPHLAKRDLYLAGESYGGRWVPSFAAAILEYNQFFTSAEADFVIPLRSILMGNPWFSPAPQTISMYDVGCNSYRGQFKQHLTDEECTKILPAVDRCEAVLRACALGGRDPIMCQQPHAICQFEFIEMFENSTCSVYDRRRRHCKAPSDCFPDITQPETYLNQDRIFNDELEVLEQTDGHRKSWSMMNMELYKEFQKSGDFYTPAVPELEKVLEYSTGAEEEGSRPIEVLIYVGIADIMCNADGVHDGLRELHWQGKTPFRGASWRELPWNGSSGGRAGRIKAVPHLWLVEMEEAGHLVPHDQPLSSLKLMEFWLDHVKSTAEEKQGGFSVLHPWGDEPDQTTLSGEL